MRALPVRTAAAAGLAAGLALLTRPDQVVARLAPAYPRDRLWIVRLLGARLVGQHAAVLAAPRREVLLGAAGVDLLHAATMVPLLGSPRYGGAARVSGALAAGYGIGALAASR